MRQKKLFEKKLVLKIKKNFFMIKLRKDVTRKKFRPKPSAVIKFRKKF